MSIKNSLHLDIDTDLTEIGKKQCLKIFNLPKLADYYFASSLKRTHQTISIIMKNNNVPTDKEIIILPCAYELNYHQNNNCDKKYKQSKLYSRENIQSCNPEICTKNINNERVVCRIAKHSNEIPITLPWKSP